MRVLVFENYEIKIAPEALSLVPFKKIWERDKSKDKSMARLELSYVYFMEDVRSDYQEYADPAERSKVIKQEEGLPEKWEPDSIVREACQFCREKQPIQARWLDSMRSYINNMETIMRDINFGVTENGKLVNLNPQTVDLLKKFNEAVKIYTKTEKEIFAETEATEKVRGSQEKADFENLNFK